MNSKKKRRVDRSKIKGSLTSMTEIQKCLMLDFITVHPDMIRNRTVGGASSDDRDALWDELALVLNSCESGAKKDGTGWRRSWNDMKRYESLKAAEAMGNLSGSHSLQLSPLQEKIASLLSQVIAQEDPESVQEELKYRKVHEAVQGYSNRSNDEKSLTLAKSLENVASALTERNAIEEKKLKIFEEFLKLFSVKSGPLLSTFCNEGGGCSHV